MALELKARLCYTILGSVGIVDFATAQYPAQYQQFGGAPAGYTSGRSIYGMAPPGGATQYGGSNFAEFRQTAGANQAMNQAMNPVTENSGSSGGAVYVVNGRGAPAMTARSADWPYQSSPFSEIRGADNNVDQLLTWLDQQGGDMAQPINAEPAQLGANNFNTAVGASAAWPQALPQQRFDSVPTLRRPAQTMPPTAGQVSPSIAAFLQTLSSSHKESTIDAETMAQMKFTVVGIGCIMALVILILSCVQFRQRIDAALKMCFADVLRTGCFLGLLVFAGAGGGVLWYFGLIQPYWKILLVAVYALIAVVWLMGLLFIQASKTILAENSVQNEQQSWAGQRTPEEEVWEKQTNAPRKKQRAGNCC